MAALIPPTTINKALCESIVDDLARKLPIFIKYHCTGCYTTQFGYERFYSGGHNLCLESEIGQFNHLLAQSRILPYYLDLDVVRNTFLGRIPEYFSRHESFPVFMTEKAFISARLQDPTFLQDVFFTYKVSCTN